MSKSVDDNLAWLLVPQGNFGENIPAHERRHVAAADADPMTTETYWFAFTDPKTNLIGHFYMKIRQVIGSCGSGAWFYRGFNPLHPMAVEHYDFHTAVPAPDMIDDTLSIPVNGLTFQMVEPMKRWRIRYEAHDGHATADLDVEARMPLAVTPRNTHFDQAVWMRGTVRIGEEIVELDCPGFRDRTWNEARPEVSLTHPPLAYIWGVSDDGTSSFCVRGTDDSDYGVHWADDYALSAEQRFHGGWINIDGDLRVVTKMSKRVKRDEADRMRPQSYEIDCTDSTGQTHRITGTVIGDMWNLPWGNVFCWFSSFEFTLNGTVKGRGESQDAVWNEYIRKYWRGAGRKV